jgi:hypothetical protein
MFCHIDYKPQRGIILGLIFFNSISGMAQTTVYCNADSRAVQFGITQVEKGLQKKDPHHKINLSKDEQSASLIVKVIEKEKDATLIDGGYRIQRSGRALTITANDDAGAMYGTLEIAEQLRSGKKFKDIEDKFDNPKLSIRAIKFNLPWSPYRTGKVMEQHYEVCRDLNFWQAFLDEMAINRFNVLSLWNVHPFSFMVKPTNFPKANAFNDQEMKTGRSSGLLFFKWPRIAELKRI